MSTNFCGGCAKHWPMCKRSDGVKYHWIPFKEREDKLGADSIYYCTASICNNFKLNCKGLLCDSCK